MWFQTKKEEKAESEKAPEGLMARNITRLLFKVHRLFS